MYWGWLLDGFGIFIVTSSMLFPGTGNYTFPEEFCMKFAGKLQVGSNCLTQHIICGELVKGAALSGGAGDRNEGVPCHIADPGVWPTTLFMARVTQGPFRPW